MENEIFVPKGAVVVCIKEQKHEFGKVGTIFETVDYSKRGGAYYYDNIGMADEYWRYATALELFCFKKYHITNIQQIGSLYREEFNKLTNYKKNGNKEENLLRTENARPNGIGQRAIAIRKPTKQIAVGIRLIGNQAKGKFLKKRITNIVMQTNVVKY